MSIKFLVASDLHLSDRIWAQRPIFGDSYHALDQIVSLALAEKPAAVILAGDILNVQTNPSVPILRMYEATEKLRRAMISVLYVQGQHDYQVEPWLSAFPNTRHLQRRPWESPPCHVAGLDFSERTELVRQLEELAQHPVDVLVLHQVWQDFMGDIVSHQLSSADIPDNVRLVVTGDYHVSRVIERTTPSGVHQKILSPGSTHLRSINEPVDKFAYLVHMSGPSPVPTTCIQPLPLSSRRVVRIQLMSYETLDEIFAAIDEGLAAAADYATKNALPPELVSPMLVLEHTDDTLAAVRSIRSKYGNAAHLFYVDRSSRVTAKTGFCAEDRATAVRQDLRSALATVLDPQKAPAEFELATRLLQADDKKNALETWFTGALTESAE